jgi:hypothetical protein
LLYGTGDLSRLASPSLLLLYSSKQGLTFNLEGSYSIDGALWKSWSFLFCLFHFKSRAILLCGSVLPFLSLPTNIIQVPFWPFGVAFHY